MKMLGLFLLATFVLVVFISGCTNPLSQDNNASTIVQQAVPANSPTNNTQTTNLPRQTYNNNEISFNYPTSWELVPAENIETIHDDPDFYRIVAVSPQGADPTLVSIQRTYSNAQLANKVSAKKQSIQNHNGQILSEKTFTLDGVPAVALTYEYADHKYRFLAVYLEKNGVVYALVLGAEKAAFGNQAGNFEMILNSFHVK
jgi:hypothetical protein